MIRVRILDESGDTALQVESKEDLLREVEERKLNSSWFYLDGKFTSDLKGANFTDIEEVIVSQPLVGG